MTVDLKLTEHPQSARGDRPALSPRHEALPRETVLRLVNVSKRFGETPAIEGVSFEVKRGEIVGVIGRSGAGKSTLIRCLNGLEKPDSGRIEVLGEDIAPLGERDLRRVRLRVGMIFQHFNLLSSKTVADNVALPLKIAGRTQSERRDRVRSLLWLVGLEDKAAAYPRQLAGKSSASASPARSRPTPRSSCPTKRPPRLIPRRLPPFSRSCATSTASLASPSFSSPTR
jgi:D-methionine transport system ATP-binding protein